MPSEVRREAELRILPTGLFLVLIAAGAVVQSQTQAPAPPSDQTVFRAGTSIVPVDVRVLDAQGKPVTDLTQSDFIVIENGVRQRITQFLTQSLVPQPAAGAESPIGKRTRVVSLSPQSRRVFLIVLGRGRLQPPAKGVDGLLHFVRDLLLPQDQVAVLAWDRATEFTTDHERIAELLERFKRQHEAIEAKLKHYFTGLTAIYGSRQIPPELRGAIDEVFNGPHAPEQRTLIRPEPPNASRVEEDIRRVTDLLQNRVTSDAAAVAEANAIGVSLDEFASLNVQTMQDVGNMYTGIRYLQYMEGEKHLVFASERTPILPRAEDDKDLASFASDARVVIHYLHTGGTQSAFGGRGISTGMDAASGSGTAGSAGVLGLRYQPWLVGGPLLGTGASFQLARTLAVQTGGLFYGNRNGKTAVDLDHIDAATRFGYTLGYTPSNRNQDGRYRRIDVRLTRPGFTVLFRHGYFAREEPAPLDRQRLITYSRVVTAANYEKDVPDLPVKVAASAPAPTPGVPLEIASEVTVDISRLRFAKLPDGRNQAAFELALFGFRRGGQELIGQWWRTIELTYTDARLEEVRRTGFHHSVAVPVMAPAELLKTVVYDYDTDLVGTTLVKLKK